MKYEYKVVSMDTSDSWWGGNVDNKDILKKINSLAKDEWELISAAPITQGSSMKGFGSTSSLLLFFKRTKK